MIRTAPAPFHAPLTFVAVLAVTLPACGGAVAPEAGPGSGPGRGAGASGSAPVAGGSPIGSGSGTVPPPSPSGAGSSPASPAMGVDAGPPPAACANLDVPHLAMTCPNGTIVGPAYSIQGGQCSLVYPCPPSPSPSPAVDASAPPVTVSPPPTPLGPTCNMPLPDVCDVCPDGETLCAHYVIVGDQCVTEICPPAPSQPPIPPCVVPGSACNGFTGCGGGSTLTGCTTSCACDSTGHYQCTSSCPPTPPPPAPVAVPCVPGNVCGPSLIACTSTADVGAGVCTTNCVCGTTGTLACTTTCGGDAGG